MNLMAEILATPHSDDGTCHEECWKAAVLEFEVSRHDENDDECVRCGEMTLIYDRAEVAEGLVHASCMRDGEEIA